MGRTKRWSPRRGPAAASGAVGLYRAPSELLFEDAEQTFLMAIGPDGAARTGLLVDEAPTPQWTDSPGLVVLSQDGEVESTTPGVERWLSDLAEE